MTQKGFCIHGHFYQPPREDPLTGIIPKEEGAFPYDNWNDLVLDQCYRPNAELGNFEHISFNVGPTLFTWLEEKDPVTYRKILEQERKNVEQNGVGNALAQPYNHTILPLASRTDKITQVLWGIGDYEYRFGHKPAGMWLPETAANTETLEVLAECGIKFTILAPWQAADPQTDISKPYQVVLSGGRKVVVFFYNQNISTRISFDPAATVNADLFYKNILAPEMVNGSNGSTESRLVLAASDGELYGHHQPFRDKFLARLVSDALADRGAINTYPALWLKRNEKNDVTTIRQNTSWSCHHGVLRWSGDCACTSHSGWKEPLRTALNLVAELIDKQYLSVLDTMLDDPWELRHKYIQVLLGRISSAQLIRRNLEKGLPEEKVRQIGQLLRAQYERQRMFTSCGWFFDDFDRIEPRNNVAYAAQAVWLSQNATGANLVPSIRSLLKKVVSWRTGLNAERVFMQHLEKAQNAGLPEK
ncbi:MAG: DUF3536 domain-containing protein [Anaerolineaceae bacterium]